MSPPAALAILGAKTTCELVGFVLMKSWKIGFTNCWIDGDGGGGDCDCKVWPFRGTADREIERIRFRRLVVKMTAGWEMMEWMCCVY
ncbi:uncharacterized protein G2W53_021397 [Senna tora]|uniref:Uncharacterized protein n=1 Tax=Senna tora TaxID=362788 RepID=A0A834TJH5_9FABA|nr:uncharacterized protein G2W53_021397 [Senna tora]